MAGTFPDLRTGVPALHPVARTLSIPTQITRFCDDTEQRWRAGHILNSWALTYNLKWADVVTLRTFFFTQKGAFDTTWQFPFLGTTYATMAFDQDDFTYAENKVGRYDITLKIRQVQQSGTYASGLTAVFPPLTGTIITQLPFTAADEFLTRKNDMPYGGRFSAYTRAAALRRWTANAPVISTAQLATWLNFFCSMSGPYRHFSLTDPNDASLHTNCRFDTDSFEAHYVAKGVCSVQLPIIEFAA